jgi:hypothetical protein
LSKILGEGRNDINCTHLESKVGNGEKPKKNHDRWPTQKKNAQKNVALRCWYCGSEDSCQNEDWFSKRLKVGELWGEKGVI